MIEIKSVRGKCLVGDGLTNTMPKPGMKISNTNRTCVLLTGPDGAMTIILNARTVKLGPKSVLRTRPSKPLEIVEIPSLVLKKHEEMVRFLSGKIWARLKGPEPLEKIVGTVAVGVRG